MKREAFFALLLGLSPVASADCPWTGTWDMRPAQKESITQSMTAESVAPGCLLTYTMAGKNMPKTVIATIALAFDGRDSRTMSGGKPTLQTMAVKLIDRNHFFTVMKYDGKQTGTVKTELSPDGRILKSEIDTTVDSPNGPAGRIVQYWDKR
jgi:hypothetical protein